MRKKREPFRMEILIRAYSKDCLHVDRTQTIVSTPQGVTVTEAEKQ